MSSEGAHSGLLRLSRPRRSLPILAFLLGASVSAAIILAVWVARPEGSHNPSLSQHVDFSFQVLNISSPRQEGKRLDVFVRWRYVHREDRCPYNASDNHCIQYQVCEPALSRYGDRKPASTHAAVPTDPPKDGPHAV